ncbi:IS1380 family transposase [Ornithinimicrobium panacihumi]|uniref:IS1380 family transposase n=1 Tax=Ornithinimicrobium panacihumi TaxID=2008449 RepID=UPI003F8921CD
MKLSHRFTADSALFDDPNLVSAAGLVPMIALAERAGLGELAQQRLSVPTDKGANAGAKVCALVGGMVAGADSIDDMALLRHGAMKKVFSACYAPSTLGSFLRAFTFGHVRQLDAVASRVLTNLAHATPVVKGLDEYAVVDVDDTIIEVHGYAKQGAGFGYTRVRGLNALLATVSTEQAAPVVVAQRLRKGSVGSPRGADRLVAEALATVARMRSTQANRPVLVRADSAFFGHPTIGAAVRAGAQVSVTVRLTSNIRAAIATIDEQAWTPIEYTDAIKDEVTGAWISRAEVAEVPFTAFTAQARSRHVPGRLVVRRIPDLNPKNGDGQDQLFDTWRFHAFFTTTDPAVLDTVAADKTHRAHAVIENVNADLKNSALAHLPSGRFAANAAWLVLAVIAFNLTRAAATLTGPQLARATTATIRRTLVTVPARAASSARRLRLHLPTNWPWQQAWKRLFASVCGPPLPATT